MDASGIEEINHLEEDHRSADHLHALVEELYGTWMGSGRISQQAGAQLLSSTQQLRQLYQSHIAHEEQEIFHHALGLLDKNTISAIGEEFRRRRA